jgi:hypothetical protein
MPGECLEIATPAPSFTPGEHRLKIFSTKRHILSAKHGLPLVYSAVLQLVYPAAIGGHILRIGKKVYIPPKLFGSSKTLAK